MYKDLGVGYFITLLDAEDVVNVAYIEIVQFSLLFDICHPGFTTIKTQC